MGLRACDIRLHCMATPAFYSGLLAGIRCRIILVRLMPLGNVSSSCQKCFQLSDSDGGKGRHLSNLDRPDDINDSGGCGIEAFVGLPPRICPSVQNPPALVLAAVSTLPSPNHSIRVGRLGLPS